MLPMHVTLKAGVMYITYPSPESTVVREIISNLQTVGKKVSVVCSSGIACTVYDPGVASTVHSCYGLGIVDLSWDQLVE